MRTLLLVVALSLPSFGQAILAPIMQAPPVAGGCSASGTPSFIGSTFGTNQTSTTHTSQATSGTLNVQSCDTIVVYIRKAVAGTNSCSDSAGNTFTAAGSANTATFGNGQYFVATVSSASATDTVTCNYGNATGFAGIVVTQYRGLSSSPVDQYVVAATSTGPPWTSGSFTTTSAHEVLIGCGSANSVSLTISSSGGYTLRQADGTGGAQMIGCGDSIVSTIQTGVTAQLGSTLVGWLDALTIK